MCLRRCSWHRHSSTRLRYGIIIPNFLSIRNPKVAEKIGFLPYAVLKRYAGSILHSAFCRSKRKDVGDMIRLP